MHVFQSPATILWLTLLKKVCKIRYVSYSFSETRYYSEHHFRDCLCTKLVWQTTKCSGTKWKNELWNVASPVLEILLFKYQSILTSNYHFMSQVTIFKFLFPNFLWTLRSSFFNKLNSRHNNTVVGLLIITDSLHIDRGLIQGLG